MKKLTPKLKFEFGDPDDFPKFNIEVNLKTNDKSKHIKIIEHKKIKKRVIDASTKLF